MHRIREQLIGTDKEEKILENREREEFGFWSSTAAVLDDLLGCIPPESSKPLLELRDGHICEKLEIEIVEQEPKTASAIVRNPAKARTTAMPDEEIRIEARLKDKWVEKLQTEKWGEECHEHTKKFDRDADPLQIPFDDLNPQVTPPVGEAHDWRTQIHRDVFS
ncbi:CAZyme family AA3 [Penicillium frequentans]|uniref:CAZyme family AA3 n=1 Tax=Penicillium frequentans TaxID=3151616 RepID=A0AAD6GKR2_9EURO|nr:CAZyme family AA3 [Penicillium glabrum]